MNVEDARGFWTILRPQDFILHCSEERFGPEKKQKHEKDSPVEHLLFIQLLFTSCLPVPGTGWAMGDGVNNKKNTVTLLAQENANYQHHLGIIFKF